MEGQTEETFVRDVLAEYLAPRRIYGRARRVETSRTQGYIFRGGMTSYVRAKRDIERWLKQDQTAYVTTMFDLYRLPEDFPSADAASREPNPLKKADIIETGILADIPEPRLLPYIQVHEFEAFLFCALDVTDRTLGVAFSYSKLAELRRIKDAFPSPEHINDGQETAPSKRLALLYKTYRKPVFGPLITERTGIVALRQECSHFDMWIQRLQALPEL